MTISDRERFDRAIALFDAWKKMSDAGHAFAVSGKTELPEPLVPPILKAVQGA